MLRLYCNVAVMFVCYVTLQDEIGRRNRLICRYIVRYVNLSWVLCLSTISIPVRKHTGTEDMTTNTKCMSSLEISVEDFK